ncbi:VOC family protein [Membranihabitans maritimus]|uniref:VOC family protein n=1 Tax=Membranihabitans maritimus TaxID=2904244 RepID=UPI001F3EED4C|nr:VOC family protein [Membranihabitans maritimus]
MKEPIITSLTFQNGNAEEAMNYYVNIFENSNIIGIHRWERNAQGKEGTIMHAVFTLNGKKFMCSDSPPIHDWNFTPAVSNFIECENIKELERLFSKLSKNGNVTMPIDNYGFSEYFGWVIDQFGISWQLNVT